MALRKIEQADLELRGVTALPDRPNLPPEELKAKFEELVRQVVVPIFNRNVEEQEAINARLLRQLTSDVSLFSQKKPETSHPERSSGHIEEGQLTVKGITNNQ